MDSFLPYNIKSDDCPPAPGGSRAEADQLSFNFYCPPSHFGGSPFTVHGKVCHIEPGGLAFTRKKDEGGRGARVARGQKEKRRSSKREVDGGGILEEAFPARWNLWTATL